MALDGTGTSRTFVCDSCGFGYGERFHPADIKAYSIRAKSEGWTTAKVGGKWKHFCSKCECQEETDWQKERRERKERAKAEKPPTPQPARRQWWQD